MHSLRTDDMGGVKAVAPWKSVLIIFRGGAQGGTNMAGIDGSSRTSQPHFLHENDVEGAPERNVSTCRNISSRCRGILSAQGTANSPSNRPFLHRNRPSRERPQASPGPNGPLPHSEISLPNAETLLPHSQSLSRSRTAPLHTQKDSVRMQEFSFRTQKSLFRVRKPSVPGGRERVRTSPPSDRIWGRLARFRLLQARFPRGTASTSRHGTREQMRLVRARPMSVRP